MRSEISLVFYSKTEIRSLFMCLEAAPSEFSTFWQSTIYHQFIQFCTWIPYSLPLFICSLFFCLCISTDTVSACGEQKWTF